MKTLAQVSHLKKSFGSTTVLDLNELNLFAGSATAVVGANGSGKSTLVKILSGYHTTVDSGELSVNGSSYSLPISAADAARLNLRFIHQDLGLIEDMSVVDNVCLAAGFGSPAGPINWSACRTRVQSILDKVGAKFSARTLVREIGPGDRVLIAMTRVLAMSDTKPGLLVLDEPTAAVPPREVGMVLDVVRARCAEGWSILYIAHDLDQVLEVADFVTVLRDGKVVESAPASNLDVAALSRAMLGEADEGVRVSGLLSPSNHGHETRALSKSEDPGKQARNPAIVLDRVSNARLQEVSISIEPGCIHGVVGLAGSGKSELGRVIAGVSLYGSGEIAVGEAVRKRQSIKQARDQGVSYVPQDRLRSGLIPQMDVAMNISGLEFAGAHSPLWLSRRKELMQANLRIADFRIVPREAQRPVLSLSGGNQQKCVLARATSRPVGVLVLDEPTSGVDVGARHQIHEIVRRLAQQGVAIVLISNDLDEVLEVSDRISIMRDGKLSEIEADVSLTRQILLERISNPWGLVA